MRSEDEYLEEILAIAYRIQGLTYGAQAGIRREWGFRDRGRVAEADGNGKYFYPYSGKLNDSTWRKNYSSFLDDIL